MNPGAKDLKVLRTVSTNLTTTTTATAAGCPPPFPKIKRSRSDLDLQNLPPPFPERADGPPRHPKLRINPHNMPKFPRPSGAVVAEVDVGSQQEMFWQEQAYAPDAEYFSWQTSVRPKMRAVLLDWMFEVSQEYGLKRDSVHVAINFVDQYLGKRAVESSSLQLVGVSCLWLGSKMEEIMPPPITDFSSATAEAYSVAQIIDMELEIARCLDWNLVPCTAYSFVSTFLQRLILNRQAAVLPRSHTTSSSPNSSFKSWQLPSMVPPVQLNRVMEIVDLAMLDSESLCFLPSVLAASAIQSLILRDPASSFSPRDVALATGIPSDELTDCLEWIAYTLELPPAGNAPPRPAALQYTPLQELHMVQRYNGHALAVFRANETRRGGGPNRRSPAAERSLRLLSAKLAAFATNEQGEDPELTAIERNHRMRRRVGGWTGGWIESLLPQPAAGDRAFSPMTDLALGLANAGVAKNSN
ncbi:hypothetical protein BASA81_002947 [Batrachochytrium salamandrivorans]|nr:hypothetical protein BASA81_002947 [Batrachochytrium salamandrivorans]